MVQDGSGRHQAPRAVGHYQRLHYPSVAFHADPSRSYHLYLQGVPGSNQDLHTRPGNLFFFQSLIGLFLYTARRSRIDISVSMDDGWSAYQGITVTNNGRQNLFRAEGQIVGSNGPANYPKGTFRLGWGNGTQPDVTIPQHASDQILVGGFEDVTNAHSLFDLRVFKLVNNESQIQWHVRWLAEDKDELPWFQLKVSVIAEGTRTPWVRTFLLIPKTRLGPLCLSAVEETT